MSGGLLHVVGVRPHFVKLSALYHTAKRAGLKQTIVHTNQHYDKNMSDVFFEELGLPRPDYTLRRLRKSSSHLQQVTGFMSQLEGAIQLVKPDWAVVYGDVNTSLAFALAASLLRVPVAHVEAGIRSGDPDMPEERNRVMIDCVADLLLAPTDVAVKNLVKEGCPRKAIQCVGSLTIDAVHARISEARKRAPALLDRYGVKSRSFALVTLHRPSNVDDRDRLQQLLSKLSAWGSIVPVIMPVHPRTKKRITEWHLEAPEIKMIPPQGYLDFIALLDEAAVILTDSGGVQEEALFLGTPCLTMRENTERPLTVLAGQNRLIGADARGLVTTFTKTFVRGSFRKVVATLPDHWDGLAAQRAVHALMLRPQVSGHRLARASRFLSIP